MAIHRYLLRNGEVLTLSAEGVQVGIVRHPLEKVKGATARVLSRGMSIDVTGAKVNLEFTDRKTREAAMEALAKLLRGAVVRKGAWGRVEVENPKI